MRRNSVWDTIQFALNGIIFVLLGEQLPAIFAVARQTVQLTGHAGTWWLGAYVLAIVAGLIMLRFAWVWVSLRLTLLRRRNRVGATQQSPDWRLVAAMSLAGVRGAITLAGVLTIPLVLNDGTPFPARDLAIFLAAGVIIVSLIVASLALPVLLNGLTMPSEPSLQAEEDAARVAAAQAAIRAVERSQHDLAERMGDADFYATAGGRVMDVYRDRIDSRGGSAKMAAEARLQDRLERDFKLVALQAERALVIDLARERQIGSVTVQKLVRELDLLEARYRG
jgi:CPA1 family monovalent cation:H+ antiporter